MSLILIYTWAGNIFDVKMFSFFIVKKKYSKYLLVLREKRYLIFREPGFVYAMEKLRFELIKLMFMI